MATKSQLERENEELRDELQELEEGFDVVVDTLIDLGIVLPPEEQEDEGED